MITQDREEEADVTLTSIRDVLQVVNGKNGA
jgi:hypothetical protein